ncbi:MAG: hypothetical protein ACRCYU_23420 [Nocardioides sp.]
MDSNTRTKLIAAAVVAAGPKTGYASLAEWSLAVQSTAVELAVMAGEDSKVVASIEQMSGVKVFSGSVMSVRKEKRSTRGVVVLETGTERENKDPITGETLPSGQEFVRTERTDDPMGLYVAQTARSLTGRKVRVYVEVESIGSGERKVRVLRHLEDLGAA